jgi:hypothetical protein
MPSVEIHYKMELIAIYYVVEALWMQLDESLNQAIQEY